MLTPSFFGRMDGTLRDRIQLYRLMWIRKHLLPPPCSILDIGAHNGGTLTAAISECSGNGFISIPEFQNLVANNWSMGYDRIVANDISEALRPHWDMVNAGIPFDVFNAGEEVWPYEDDSFDNVLLCEVLEHMTEPQWVVALQQAYRVCSKQILITLPLDEGLETETNRDQMGPDDHKYRPRFSELKRFVVDALCEDPLMDLYHVCHYQSTVENRILLNGIDGFDEDLHFIYMRIVKNRWW